MVPQFLNEHVPGTAEFDTLGAPYGGVDPPGLNPIARGPINREFQAGDSGFRSFISVQTSLVRFQILQ